MSDLELDGVEDGWLVLRGPGPARHRLPLDDALRSALQTPGETETEPAAASTLVPREIQDRLRRGVPVEEIAREAGTTAERIARWEPPVLAERAAAVQRARATRFSRPPDGSASGPLGALVDARLKAVGVVGEWDAWRERDGSWTVQVSHGDGQARWRFDGASLTAQDRNAEQLGWAVRPHLVRPEAVPDLVAESEPDEAWPPAAEPAATEPAAAEPTAAEPAAELTAAEPAAAESAAAAPAAEVPAAAPARERARRSSLPTWEHIFGGTPPSTFSS